MHSHNSPTISNKSFNDGDTGIEQPSLEFDESWKLHMYEVKSPDVSSDEPNQKHKIVLRDLSFDDNAPLSELTRIDLLCPVFLAVTEDKEDDDHVLKDIRRKTKSIENLATTWDDDQGMLFKLLFQSKGCPKSGNSRKIRKVYFSSEKINEKEGFFKKSRIIKEVLSFIFIVFVRARTFLIRNHTSIWGWPFPDFTHVHVMLFCAARLKHSSLFMKQ